MLIPYEKLSQDALDGLIEEFVTRDGTEFSGVDGKIEQVYRGLQAERLVIVFDPEEGSCNIVCVEDLSKLEAQALGQPDDDEGSLNPNTNSSNRAQS